MRKNESKHFPNSFYRVVIKAIILKMGWFSKDELEDIQLNSQVKVFKKIFKPQVK